MSTSYIMGGAPSSQGSSYGVNKLTFGQKAKKKTSNVNLKEMNENDYENLCMEVTRRIINNRREEQELYGKLYCNTTKNLNLTMNTSQFSFAGGAVTQKNQKSKGKDMLNKNSSQTPNSNNRGTGNQSQRLNVEKEGAISHRGILKHN